MRKDDIIVTDHAKERAKEWGLKEDKIKDLLVEAKKQKQRPSRELYKIDKYGIDKQLDVYYFLRNGSVHYPRLLFTVRQDVNKDGGDLWVVITVTKK
jgi:hypothetical protein